MSAELDELYQSIILDHNRRPKNFRTMEDASAVAEGLNPLCGDQLKVWVRFDGDTLADVSFQGHGCAISKASASMMTQIMKGKSRTEAGQLFDDVHALITGRPTGADVGALASLSGVSKFPLRVKCASLAWHAMKSALSGGGATTSVSTEGDGPGPSGA